MDNSIGYIINESYSEPVDITHVKMLNGKVIAECVIQTADQKNRNGRYYAEEELFPQLKAPRTLELLESGTLRAECGHPLSKDLQRQATIDDTRTCARFLKLWTEGKDIKAWVVGTNNELGKAFDLDLKEGVKPAWSLRALGSVQQTRRGCEVRNLKLITWDNVIYPSHPTAYTLGLVSESTSMLHDNRKQSVNESSIIMPDAELIPFCNTDVVNYIKSESVNMKYIKEFFDFSYNSISLNENGSKVILKTSDGDTLVVNLENYIAKELMNYGNKSYMD